MIERLSILRVLHERQCVRYGKPRLRRTGARCAGAMRFWRERTITAKLFAWPATLLANLRSIDALAPTSQYRTDVAEELCEITIHVELEPEKGIHHEDKNLPLRATRLARERR
jgi:hypothetical protein